MKSDIGEELHGRTVPGELNYIAEVSQLTFRDAFAVASDTRRPTARLVYAYRINIRR
jgi:hypothetical protein